MKQHILSSAPVLCGLGVLIVAGTMISLLVPEDWEILALTGAVFLSAWVGWEISLKLDLKR